MTNPSIFMRKGRETISNIYYFWAKIEVKHPQFEIPNEGPVFHREISRLQIFTLGFAIFGRFSEKLIRK